MSKRRKFLICSAVLAVIFWLLQYVPLDYRELAILIFAIITYAVGVMALKDDLHGVEWLTLLLLPVLFSVAAGFFYFLLTNSQLVVRVIVGIFYLVGMYAILLTENIYSVAAVRTIQLLRAAHAVGFLMTVLTAVLLFNALFSFHWPFYLNVLVAFLVSIPIYLQALWVVKLDDRVTMNLWGMSVILALLTAEIAMGLSFLPVTVWVASLFVGTVIYVVMGLMQQALQDRLFERTVWEYTSVGVIVMLATLAITPWK